MCAGSYSQKPAWAERFIVTERLDKKTGEMTSAESMNSTSAAYSKAKLFKHDPYSVERSRKVIVLIGITGAGKSATANTLCGAKRAFETAASISSVTSAARVRDYSFNGSRYRVIDTPGLGDTHKPYDVTKAELLDAWRFARHGVACFIVVVPKGRLTAEMELRVREALDIFGGSSVIPHAMIAMTRAQDAAPEKLVDEVMRLPQDHSLRRLCDIVGHRIVPVENVKEPLVAVSRLMIHKAVDEVLEINDDQRYSHSQSTTAALEAPPALSGVFAGGLPAARCSSAWSLSDEKQPRLVITCDFGASVGA
eukprot:TRINITY_DN20796_c0_g2_i2.p1 TRINITY_DN20796_c0_g2~~TRINITY_DN20796_c0_g2_i2.p1  ORF type:complete len:355 (+),score=76.66 TRINITY_DN20796_c0_g2_i2:141-1067(+)